MNFSWSAYRNGLLGNINKKKTTLVFCTISKKKRFRSMECMDNSRWDWYDIKWKTMETMLILYAMKCYTIITRGFRRSAPDAHPCFSQMKYGHRLVSRGYFNWNTSSLWVKPGSAKRKTMFTLTASPILYDIEHKNIYTFTIYLECRILASMIPI